MKYYDELYAENERYWGLLPSPVSLLVLAHCKSGKVLDLGCGQGPDALFFAKKGLQVTAIDTSSVAIEHLKKTAQEFHLTVDAREQDMNDFPDETFDIVFSRMALQMITPEKRIEYIEKLKKKYPGMLHAHVIPISGACFGDAFICEKNLLQDAYKDWKTLFYEESWTISRVLNKNGEPFLMREARIIAKNN